MRPAREALSMLGYTIITAWNVGLMVAIARWRGLASFEGLGMALLALVVVTDYGGVLPGAGCDRQLAGGAGDWSICGWCPA